MTDIHAASAELVVGEIGHSAFTALGADEMRRWEVACRGLEEGDVHPWPAVESKDLMDGILSCLFGDDLARLDAPARAWARTNRTMATFTRRLGCLRELVAQESLVNGPESSDRVQEIFDRVTIVATEAALVHLVYTPARGGRPEEAAASLVEPEPAAEGAEPVAADIEGACADDAAAAHADGPDEGRRRRTWLLVLAGLVVALLVGGVALALTSGSAPARHPGGSSPSNGAHGSGSSGAPGAGPGSPGAPGSGTGSGAPTGKSSGSSGVAGRPGSTRTTSGKTGSDDGGPASTTGGTVPSGTGSTTGTGTSDGSAGSGSGASGGTGSSGGGSQSNSIPLPGGGSITPPTLPTVTLPGGAPVTTPAISLPSQTVTLPGGTTVTVPGINLGKL